MDDLRVPTTSLPVEILCADGRAMLGDIFLPAQSSLQSGPDAARRVERVRGIRSFRSARSRRARSTILNRSEVVAVTVPAAVQRRRPTTPVPDVPVVRLAVEAGGTRFEGDVLVDMPPGHQRVADWLNAPAAFITVRAGSAHHLIQKRHVTRVVELCRLSS